MDVRDHPNGRPHLNPAQQRRLRITRGILLACIVGSLVTLATTVWLFVAGASSTWRAVSTAVFVEFAASAAVLGAFAKCPACGGRLGSESGHLLPRRCPRCKVDLTEQAASESEKLLR